MRLTVEFSDDADVGVDVAQGCGNVWGDTPGVRWGHGPERTTGDANEPASRS